MTSCKDCKSLLPSTTAILFCPQCGATINDIENELAKGKNQKAKKLNMLVQILISVVPFLGFVAAFRVKKQKSFLTIYAILVSVMIFSVFIQAIIYTYLHIYSTGNNSLYLLSATPLFGSWMMIYWIRKWTIEYNDLIDFLSTLRKKSYV